MDELNSHISGLRKDYSSSFLDEKNVAASPFSQFNSWMQEAIRAEIPEVNAITLSTANKNGKPSSRIVLLRGFSEQGFKFFTNYQSKKGIELTENPFASINIFWHELEKQIRIEGKVERLSETQSDEYFASRPLESQLGAWASQQSGTLKNREEMERIYAELIEKHKNSTVPRPSHWGGFILKPDYFEFWQGRANRLHDRISYTLKEKDWLIERLFP